jgi:hypothetical protein
VDDGPACEPAEDRQVLLVSPDLEWGFEGRVVGEQAAVLQVRREDACDRRQVRIILGMPGCTDMEVRATDRREAAETAPKPPLLQSTSCAQVSPNRGARITALLQPSGEVIQDRAEQPERRISPVHSRE